MEAVKIFLMILGAACIVVTTMCIVDELLLEIRFRRKMREWEKELQEPEPEEPEPEPEDPCETCLRWPECNGVDHDTCELVKEGISDEGK